MTNAQRRRQSKQEIRRIRLVDAGVVELQGTLRDIRVLRNKIQIGSVGNQDARVQLKLLDKLHAALGEYGEHVDAAVITAQAAVRDKTATVEMAQTAANIVIGQLDAQYDADTVFAEPIALLPSEAAHLKARWKQCDTPADEASLRLHVAIEDMIEGMKPLEMVAKAPTPLHDGVAVG